MAHLVHALLPGGENVCQSTDLTCMGVKRSINYGQTCSGWLWWAVFWGFGHPGSEEGDRTGGPDPCTK